MKTLHFRTKISKRGTIQIPENSVLKNAEEVDVIIMAEEKQVKNPMKGEAFVKKWAGILKSEDVKDAKFDYLMEKHK